MTEHGRIDTHHHIVPPQYRDWLISHGETAGGLPIPQWDVDTDLAFMDSQGIQTGVLSVSTPGTHLGDDAEATVWARKVNDYAAEIVKDRPDRYGFFATLTLPDVDGALNEAARALDELGADGIVLLANQSGTYLGDPAFEPLMAELGRRGTAVFIHPAELPGPLVPGVPPYAADFLLDTTRSAINLVLSGTTTRHPDIRFILSHGGGFLPYAAHRIALALQTHQQVNGIQPAMDHETILAELRRFYFDTALSANPDTLPTLLAFADPTRITFGSDFPYTPAKMSAYFTQHLDAYPLDDQQRTAINHGNAQALFPRLAR
ncbi:amidohydrolase family protein [Streptomyces naphthomycinicus]|uniref:amidohydrolase family protein n=1 Tax=Streptomyces naphthomycinicus TaxID=2872625 RepID=UPI001CEDCC30|nr:amidohydrolase family protein [Streptomyces sp. TML10]